MLNQKIVPCLNYVRGGDKMEMDVAGDDIV